MVAISPTFWSNWKCRLSSAIRQALSIRQFSDGKHLSFKDFINSEISSSLIACRGNLIHWWIAGYVSSMSMTGQYMHPSTRKVSSCKYNQSLHSTCADQRCSSSIKLNSDILLMINRSIKRSAEVRWFAKVGSKSCIINQCILKIARKGQTFTLLPW